MLGLARTRSTQAALGAAVDRLAQDLYELEAHFVFLWLEVACSGL